MTDTSAPIPLDLTLRLLDDQAALAQLAKDRGWTDAELVAHLQAVSAGQGQPISLDRAQAVVLYQKQPPRKRKRAWVHSEAAAAWRAELAQIKDAGRGTFDLEPWPDRPTVTAEEVQALLAQMPEIPVVPLPPSPPVVSWQTSGERPPDAQAWTTQMTTWQTKLTDERARLATPLAWNGALFQNCAKVTLVGWLASMVIMACVPPVWGNVMELLVGAMPVLAAAGVWGWARHRRHQAQGALEDLQARHDCYLPHAVTLGDEALWRTHVATAETWATLQASGVPILARDAQALDQAVADYQYGAFTRQQGEATAARQQQARAHQVDAWNRDL